MQLHLNDEHGVCRHCICVGPAAVCSEPKPHKLDDRPACDVVQAVNMRFMPCSHTGSRLPPRQHLHTVVNGTTEQGHTQVWAGGTGQQSSRVVEAL